MRQGWANTAKGAATIFVVLFHSALWIGAANIEVPRLWAILLVLSPLTMPVFFAVLGVSAYGALQRSWGSLLLRQVIPCLYLFLVWRVIELGTMAAAQAANGGWSPGEISQYVAERLGSNTSLWFIVAVAAFFVLAKLCQPLPRLPVLFAAGLLSVVAHGRGVAWPLLALNGARYFLFFYGACHYRALVRQLPELPVAVPVLLLALYGPLCVLMRYEPVPALGGLVLVVSALVGVAMMLAGAGVMQRRCQWLGRALAVLGKQSLAIYLLHSPVLIVIAALHRASALQVSGAGALLLALGSAILGIAASLLVQQALRHSRFGLWLLAPRRLGLRARGAAAAEVSI